MVTIAADAASRSASQRAQPGPRAPTWAGSTTTGSASTTGSPTSPAALGVAQLERLDEMLADARRGRRAATREALAGHRGRSSRRAPTAAPSGAAGSSTRSGSRRRVDRDAVDRRARASAASPARPTCRASTSSRTCASSATARASSRSPRTPRRARWRCRSSRAMTRGQVERVAEALRDGPRDCNPILAADVPLPQRPRSPLLAAQPLARVRLAAGALRHRPVAGARRGARGASASSTRPSWSRSTPASTRSGPRCEGGGFEFRERRRGHPHGDRAAAQRGGRAARRQAAHRPLAQRPGRHRRRAVRPGALAAGDRAASRR